MSGKEIAELFNKAFGYAEKGRLEAALSIYDKVLAIDAEVVEARYNRANLLVQMGRDEEAIQAYATVPKAHSLWAQSRYNMGLVAVRDDELGLAEMRYREALGAEIPYPPARIGLAEVLSTKAGRLRDEGRFADAFVAITRARNMDPDNPEWISNMGLLRLAEGKPEDALSAFNQALAIAPNDNQIRYNRSMAALSLGSYEDGWRDYEARLLCEDSVLSRMPSNAPLWRGEPLDGRSVLLVAEQGLGDTIQFARFAPLITKAGGRPVLAVKGGLTPLLSSLKGVEVVDKDGLSPLTDLQTPLLSLPYLLGLKAQKDFRRAGSYLKADPRNRDRWRQRLADQDGLKVGLSWRGSSLYPADATRSMALSDFQPLFNLPGVHLYGLQKGEGAEEVLFFMGENAPKNFTNLAPELDKEAIFADTAAVVENLDVVITVDTALCHLTGALGRSAWVCLSASPDWRNGWEGERSPWYDSLTLYRQSRHGKWTDVVERLSKDLNALIAKREAK